MIAEMLGDPLFGRTLHRVRAALVDLLVVEVVSPYTCAACDARWDFVRHGGACHAETCALHLDTQAEIEFLGTRPAT